MDGLNESVSIAVEELSSLEQSRESAIACSRRVIRLTKTVIHDIHTGSDPEGHLSELEELMKTMREHCDKPLIECSGPVQDAMGEYAEAIILYSIINDRPIPNYMDLGITAGTWILGLADSEGELRRAIMSELMDGNIDDAKRLFSKMESVHELVMLLDVPDAISPMRRKQDIARGIMDKTRSDITTASIMHR